MSLAYIDQYELVKTDGCVQIVVPSELYEDKNNELVNYIYHEFDDSKTKCDVYTIKELPDVYIIKCELTNTVQIISTERKVAYLANSLTEFANMLFFKYEPLLNGTANKNDAKEAEFSSMIESNHWTESTIKYETDVTSWKTVPADIKSITTSIISGFANLEKHIVDDAADFASIVKQQEVKDFQALKSYNESVHQRSYEKAIQIIAKDKVHEIELNESFLHIPAIGAKTNFAKKWIKDGNVPKNFGCRILARTIFEGVNFMSSFEFIRYLKEQGYMPGICLLNDYVSRDEWTHTEEGCHLVNQLINAVPVEIVYTIVKESVNAEIDFFNYVMGDVVIPGLTKESMAETVMSYADSYLENMNYPKIWNAKITIDRSVTGNISKKVNNFENPSAQYQDPEKHLNISVTDFVGIENIQF